MLLVTLLLPASTNFIYSFLTKISLQLQKSKENDDEGDPGQRLVLLGPVEFEPVAERKPPLLEQQADRLHAARTTLVIQGLFL